MDDDVAKRIAELDVGWMLTQIRKIFSELKIVALNLPAGPFEHYVAVFEYAQANGLQIACEGHSTFAKWQARLPAGTFKVCEYKSRNGIKRCGLFPKQFRHVEFLVSKGIVGIHNGVVRVFDEEAFTLYNGLVGPK